MNYVRIFVLLEKVGFIRFVVICMDVFLARGVNVEIEERFFFLIEFCVSVVILETK